MTTILEQLFMKHYEEWCLISYSYLKNKIEAEEVVQDVCASILLRKKNTKISNLEAYIKIAIKNKSLKKIQYAKKFSKLNSENRYTQPSFEESIINKEQEVLLQKAIANLPKTSRLIFNLCAVEGQKYRSVADTLGLSVNTIKYHMKSAYKTLRSQVRDLYYSFIFIVATLFL